MDLQSMNVQERIVRLGSDGTRVGVLTRGRNVTGPSIAFLNVGWLHHIGSNRLHVSLARRLAREGCMALRFDFSGIGDSASRADGLPRPSAIVSEGMDALSFLKAEGGDRPLIVGGICSGADSAYRIALQDERVDGVFFVNAFPYRTVGWYLRNYAPRLVRLSTWKRLLSGRDEVRRSMDEALASPVGRDVPPLAEARQELQKLVDGGVRLLFVFTGALSGFYNHQRQFGEMFPDLAKTPRVRAHYLRDVNESFVLEDDQILMAEIMEEWVAGFEHSKARAR